MELSTILSGLAAGTLTVPIVAYLLKHQRLSHFNKGQKRALAFGASFTIGILAYLLSVQMGYSPQPMGGNEWLEALWPVAAASFTASQAVLSAWRSEIAEKMKPKKEVEPQELTSSNTVD